MVLNEREDERLFYEELYKICEDAGIVLVIAAGNERELEANNSNFTADFSYSPDVSSLYPIYAMSHNINYELSYFSSYTKNPDFCTILAPGDEIWTTLGGGGCTIATGTSFSAPIVTSAIALMLSQDDNLTPQEIRDIINSESKVEVLDGVNSPILNIESLLNKTQQPL